MDNNLDSELCTHLAICFLAIGMLLLSAILEYVAPTFRDLLTIASILCGFAGTWSGIMVIGNLVKRSLLRRFKRLGAFSPEEAVTLDQLELDESIDPPAFKQLLEQEIVKVTADNKAYQECMCPEKELCLYPALKPKCPFYNYVNVPWATKQLFMTKVNRLVALQSPSNIDVVVTEYVTSKMTKPLDWKV